MGRDQLVVRGIYTHIEMLVTSSAYPGCETNEPSAVVGEDGAPVVLVEVLTHRLRPVVPTPGRWMARLPPRSTYDSYSLGALDGDRHSGLRSQSGQARVAIST